MSGARTRKPQQDPTAHSALSAAVNPTTETPTMTATTKPTARKQATPKPVAKPRKAAAPEKVAAPKAAQPTPPTPTAPEPAAEPKRVCALSGLTREEMNGEPLLPAPRWLATLDGSLLARPDSIYVFLSKAEAVRARLADAERDELGITRKPRRTSSGPHSSTRRQPISAPTCADPERLRQVIIPGRTLPVLPKLVDMPGLTLRVSSNKRGRTSCRAEAPGATFLAVLAYINEVLVAPDTPTALVGPLRAACERIVEACKTPSNAIAF